MARITHDREDLLREATALLPRVMLKMQIRGQNSEVFAGFRGESLSIYFDASPVYHFNRDGELRRAFVDDRLIKAEVGQLVGSVRERSAVQVVLAAAPLSAIDTDRFAAGLTDRLAELGANLNSGDFEVVGQVPEGNNVVSKLQIWLANWSGLRIAAVPNLN